MSVSSGTGFAGCDRAVLPLCRGRRVGAGCFGGRSAVCRTGWSSRPAAGFVTDSVTSGTAGSETGPARGQSRRPVVARRVPRLSGAAGYRRPLVVVRRPAPSAAPGSPRFPLRSPRRAGRCCWWPGEPAAPAADTSHHENRAGRPRTAPTESSSPQPVHSTTHLLYVTSFVTRTSRQYCLSRNKSRNRFRSLAGIVDHRPPGGDGPLSLEGVQSARSSASTTTRSSSTVARR